MSLCNRCLGVYVTNKKKDHMTSADCRIRRERLVQAAEANEDVAAGVLEAVAEVNEDVAAGVLEEANEDEDVAAGVLEDANEDVAE